MKHLNILILLLLAGLFSCNSGEQLQNPNIVYILADDMGIGDVQAFNTDGRIQTPNIDRLAHEGMKFMDAHTNSSVCTPTRYGILTGRYSWRTYLKQGVLSGHSTHLIDTGRETVASLLKKQGYATACFGKWHLGMDWPSNDGEEVRRSAPKNLDFDAPIQNGPLDLGFDYYFGIAGSLNMDPHAFVEDRHFQGTPEFLKNLEAVAERGYIQPAKPGWAAKEYEQEEVLATLAGKTCDWIRSNADQPFFVYLPLPSPHSPIVPSEKFKGKSGLNSHADFCMETDWVVGEVLKTLDELGLADNTIVIYTADNGTSPKAGFGELQKMGHYPSWKYRGAKGTLWEGGHRVPFVVRWPDGVKAGTESNQTICTTDLFATCADLLDLETEEDMGEDSYSFLPALKGERIEKAEGRMIVHHSDKGVYAIRRGKWKLMFDNQGGSNRRNPKDQPVINNSEYLLFDMEEDEVESTNLYAENPEVVESLKEQLAELIESGRSTPGEPLKNDPMKENEAWKQIDMVREYMDGN